MTEYEKLNFEEGLDYIVQTINEGLNKPLIIALIGPLNSGKSKLKLDAHRLLDKEGKLGIICMQGGDLPSCGKGYYWNKPSDLDYVIIEDTIHIEPVKRYSLDNFGKYPDKIFYMDRALNNLPDWLEKDLENKIYDAAIVNPMAKEKH